MKAVAYVSGDLTIQPGLGAPGVAKSTGFAMLFGLSWPHSSEFIVDETGNNNSSLLW